MKKAQIARDENKVLDTLSKIEAIFHTFASARGIEETLSMINTGNTIYFEFRTGDGHLSESSRLNRVLLETIDDVFSLTNVIVSNIKEATEFIRSGTQVKNADPVEMLERAYDGRVEKTGRDLSLNFRIISFADDKFSPYSVIRESDDDVFTIGDFVTNGTKMRGRIERFELSPDLDDLYVYTDWSGIGMNLDSVTKVIMLPSQHQVGDKVEFYLTLPPYWPKQPGFDARVNAVHFFHNKVKYDLEIYYKNEAGSTRLYNIDSDLVRKKD
jgi:hypothetical protein